jgi:hypothetical protein
MELPAAVAGLNGLIPGSVEDRPAMFVDVHRHDGGRLEGLVVLKLALDGVEDTVRRATIRPGGRSTMNASDGSYAITSPSVQVRASCLRSRELWSLGDFHHHPETESLVTDVRNFPVTGRRSAIPGTKGTTA